MDPEYYKNIFIPGYEQADIVGDITVFVLEHIKSFPDHSPRTVARTVRRAIYRIIRGRVTFEGCSDKTKATRRKLQCPISNIQPLHDSPQTTVDIFEGMKSDKSGPSDVLVAEELSTVFRKRLHGKELQIYDLMLDGNTRPRDICTKIYGEYIELKSKTISKHMISIRKKFAAYYKEETGNVVGKRSR
jgi:hypothetical protein